MTDKEIIKNAHCKYFEGQTGLCQAKEFKRCNPINCKLYIIDELSTILDLQEQLQYKTQECEELKRENKYQVIKLNKIKNFVKGLMFDVECENWWERFVFSFENWRNSITNQSDCYRQALKDIKNILAKPIININNEVAYNSMELGMYLRGETENRLNKLKEVLQILNEVKDAD